MFREGSWNHSVEGRISDVSGRISTLEEANLISRCGTLETDVSGLKTLTTSHTSTLSNHAGRITALENWKSVMPKRVDVYAATTDANGEIVINFPVGRYTAIPKVMVDFVFNNDNYGSFYNLKSVSASSVTIRVMRNKNSAVLLGGNIDPDEPLASTPVNVIVMEF